MNGTTKTPQKQQQSSGNNTDHDQQSTHRNTRISAGERNYIIASCAADFRLDGRSNLDHRHYSLLGSSSNNNSATSTPPLLLSNGSSRLTLPGSTTDILCSIKAELIHPSPLHPNEGVIDLNLDILPYSNATTNSTGSGSSSSEASKRSYFRNMELEISSILTHLFLPHIVDKSSPSMVVVKGRYVWRLHLDVLVLQCDGNLLDGCSVAIWGALQNLRLPKVTPVISGSSGGTAPVESELKQGKKASDEVMLDSDIEHSIRPTGVENCPIVVTVSLLPNYNSNNSDNTCTRPNDDTTNMSGKSIIFKVEKTIDNIMIVDATRQEETCASTKVSISVDPMGRICGVHKYGSADGGGGKGTIPFKILSDVGNVAIATSKRVMDSLIEEANGRSNDEKEYGNLLQGHFELRL